MADPQRKRETVRRVRPRAAVPANGHARSLRSVSEIDDLLNERRQRLIQDAAELFRAARDFNLAEFRKGLGVSQSEAARRAGIRVNGVRVAVFTISGSMAAIGGIMAASRLFAVNQNSGGSDGCGSRPRFQLRSICSCSGVSR